MVFKINDFVKIKSNSSYYSTQGIHGIGKITELINKGSVVIYGVMFQDGFSNKYPEQELEITKESKDKLGMIIPTIGCDPELEIFDRFGIVQASNVMGGNSSGLVGTDGNSAIAEIRPEASNNAVKLSENVKKAIVKLKFKCDKYFGTKDYIVRVGNGKRYPIGGHIHIGICDSNNQKKIVEAFNILSVGLTSIYMKEYFTFRRKNGGGFGSLGETRGQPWGFEYRTPPSFILNSDLTTGILCMYHSLSIDAVNNKLKDNKHYQRLSKWYNNYKGSINTSYNNCEKPKYKLKPIIKMIQETYGYKNIKEYRTNIDKIFNMFKTKQEMDETKNVIEEWGVKNLFSKMKIKLFKISDDEFMDKLIIGKKSFSVNSNLANKYENFPLRVYGLRKSRNIDIATDNNIIYKIISDYIKENNKKWCLKLDKITENKKSEIGLGYLIRKNEIDELNKMLDYLVIKIKGTTKVKKGGG